MYIHLCVNCPLILLLTPWSRVLLEKLTGSAASQVIPRIFGTRRFPTVLTSARHPSLSWANSIQSPQPPPTSWRSILILSSYLRLGLPNGLLPSGFPTRTLCTHLPSAIHALCPTHLILLNFTTHTVFGKEYRCPLFLLEILIRFEFSQQILKKYADIKFHENPSRGSRVVPCGLRDGRICWN